MGVRTCRELLALEYGSELQTRIQESYVTIGTTTTQLVSGNGARIWLSVSNLDSAQIYFSTLQSVQYGQGIILLSGASLTYHWKHDGDLPIVALYAAGTSPDVHVYVVEQILIG